MSILGIFGPYVKYWTMGIFGFFTVQLRILLEQSWQHWVRVRLYARLYVIASFTLGLQG